MIKLLTAVIRPHRLDAVRDALLSAGVSGMTLTEVRGCDGSGDGDQTEVYRGAEYTVGAVSGIRIEVVVDLFEAERLAEAVTSAAFTGRPGDGKLWISEIEQVRRIRTGERGLEALQ